MTKTIICFAFSVIVSLAAYSQKNIDPDGKDKDLAKNLKDKFPDDNVALEISTDRISFGVDKKNNKITVDHILNETLINIGSRADIHQYTFYDGESKIEEFSIRYKNNRKASFFPKDEAYTSNDLFHNDTRVKYITLDFPVKGYKYLSTIHKSYRDIKYFTKLYINGEYPTTKKTIEIEVPNWLDIELKEINFEGYDITKTIISNDKNKSKTYTFTVNDVPAMHKEKNAPGPTYLYPHILILAKSFTVNDKTQNLFASTQDLYNWYKSLVDDLENTEKPFSAKVTELTTSAASDEEKIKNIYYWVQDNIRYIAFEDGIAGFKPDEAANVFNKKYGDCKGMANLLKEMLIEADFDARLTWIGTKRIAYDYSTPNLSVDNHMICTLFKDGKTIFLDGTEKFNAFGEYADRIQNKQVMIEDGEKYILKTVPQIDSNFNKEIVNYNLSIQDEAIVGTVNKTFRGESRSSILYHLNTMKNDKKDTFLERYLSSNDSDIKVSDINTSDLNNRDVDLDINYTIKIENATSSFDGVTYLDIDFEKEFQEFMLDKRKTDFVFSYKQALESTTTLQVPNGYAVSDLPENIAVSSDNYDLKLEFSKTNNAIIYKKQFVIKNAKIETSDFTEWNSFIAKLKASYNQQITLTKS